MQSLKDKNHSSTLICLSDQEYLLNNLVILKTAKRDLRERKY